MPAPRTPQHRSIARHETRPKEQRVARAIGHPPGLPNMRGWWQGSAGPKLEHRSSPRGDPMSTRTALTAGVTLACVTCGAAAVTLPDPTIPGTVVDDFNQPYEIDGKGGNPRDPAPGEEPFVIPDAFRRTVQIKVIHDTDGTYDFYFRITTGLGDAGVR